MPPTSGPAAPDAPYLSEKLSQPHATEAAESFPRISRPVELLRPSYDVVVIGSGYGGGVAASRMARGGQTVCVLERGKERWPGEYPASLKDAAPQLHVSGALTPDDRKRLRIPVEGGDPTGLYHLVMGSGQNAFVANGLGGTSLINANIFLKADERTLAMKYWPREIRDDPSCLDKYYKRAEDMLEPEPYPETLPALKKLETLEGQAAQLGVANKFYRPPQTTRFTDGPNSSGVQMRASTLSGQDSTGVNDGSKTTTLVTYLADAWNWGAEIFCECEARYIKKHPSGEGYLVFFAWHGAKRGKFGEELYRHLMWVHAKKMVFVGAGALGSTEIMLRSKQLGLRMSDAVGKEMSGNGDILAFGYNLPSEVNAIGREVPLPERPVGPTITGVIDCRDAENPLDGFVIQEGAVASSLASFMLPMFEFSPGRVTAGSTSPADSAFARAKRRMKSVLGGPYASGGSVEHTQVYLVMSHDSNQAVMSLDPETSDPRLVFQGVGRAEHAGELRRTLAQLGGTLVQNLFHSLLGQAEITVHPIGGMNLGRATSHLGEVLEADGEGAGVHEGLVVVDGAIVPAALGVNPLATITALAERAVEGVAEKFGVSIDYDTKNGLLDLFGSPRFATQPADDPMAAALIRAQKDGTTGIGFSEIMRGFVHVGGEIEEFNVAAEQARADLHDALLFLSVNAFDEDALLSQSDHPAILTGTFSSALPGSPHMVTRGRFGLFTLDERAADSRNLTYDFDMIGTDGEMLHFHGYKVINNAAAFSISDLWAETTTLFATVTKGSAVEVVGRGILNIEKGDFARQLATVDVRAVDGSARVSGLAAFAQFFTRQLSRVFFAPFAPAQPPVQTPPRISARPEPSERFTVTASDGVVSEMQMWEPTRVVGGKVMNLILIPGASVDEQIFSLSTIPRNAVEYFTDAGYRCFSIVFRIGMTPNSKASPGWTPYDARLDIRAALEAVWLRGNKEKFYVVAHCVGSVALTCGILDGTIPARDWFRGLTISQVFIHPFLGTLNNAKAGLPLPALYKALAGTSYLDCVPQPGIMQAALTQLLRFYPVGGRKEICSSPVCHRGELAFGRLWNHVNLNKATHDRLDQLFGGVSMNTLSQLAAMGRAHVMLNNDGKPLLAPPPKDESALLAEKVDPALENLRGIPILLFSGADNVVYAPESTDVSYTLLRRTFGAELYERVLFAGRGHLDCWMSPTCADEGDVYDTVLRHVDAICRDGATGTGENGLSAGQRVFTCAAATGATLPPKQHA